MFALLAAAISAHVAIVPVIVCGTPRDKADSPDAPAPESMMQVQLPEAIARKLAAYWLWSGDAYLAPRGLSCRGEFGEDGSELLEVGPIVKRRLIPVVRVGGEFGCAGCKYDDTACYFAAARRGYIESLDFAPKCPRSTRERRVRLGTDVVAFERNVRGSRRGKRVHGVVFFKDISGTASCFLPDSDKSLCTAILNQFIQTERTNDANWL